MTLWATFLGGDGAGTCLCGPELPVGEVRALLAERGPVREIDWRRPPTPAEAVRAERELAEAVGSAKPILVLLGTEIDEARREAMHAVLARTDRGPIVVMTPDSAPSELFLKPFARVSSARALKGG